MLAGLRNEFDDRIGQLFDNHIGIRTGISLHNALGENLAACIDHAELATLAADVYAYYVIFIHIILPEYLC